MALVERGGWGELSRLAPVFAEAAPTPTLPRKRERELTVDVAASNQCFYRMDRTLE